MIFRKRRSASQRKGFAANAAHELRAPVTIIQGFAETLHEYPDLPFSQRQEVTSKIVASCRRLDSLIKGLLVLADIENLSQMQFEWTDVGQLVEQCRQHLLFAHSQAQVMIESENELPLIRAEPNLLSMAIMNLMENAIRYSPPSAPITLSIFRDPANISIQVVDRGIGIPQSELSRIFDRFHSVARARSRQCGGLGLGLFLVQAIVNQHKGCVSVESKLGEGSSFCIRLPIC